MGILDTIRRDVASVFGRKASAIAPLIFRTYGSQENGVWTKRNFAQYSDDAYKRNVVAYRAITVVARALANIPLEVYTGEKEAPATHPLAVLLKRPNPWQHGSEFWEALAGYYMLAGNSYIEAVGPDGRPPLELWVHRPDRMRVKPGKLGPIGYIYELNGEKRVWDADPINGTSPILHLRTFNPLDDWYGMSPVEAAAYSVDQHNMAGEWNQALLQNCARPSGAMVYTNESGGVLSEKQYERLKEEINAAYAGGRNAGRPMILEGGLDWKQMSLTPAEMDWINGKNVSSREIAQAFGVPSQILGIPGDNTYSNYQEARQSLYEDTILPVHASFISALNTWLCPAYGAGVSIKANIENLPAMAAKREKRWTMVQGAGWLTINEKREATGFDRVNDPSADIVLIPSGLVPLDDMNVPIDAREGDPAEDTEDPAEDDTEDDTEEETEDTEDPAEAAEDEESEDKPSKTPAKPAAKPGKPGTKLPGKPGTKLPGTPGK